MEGKLRNCRSNDAHGKRIGGKTFRAPDDRPAHWAGSGIAGRCVRRLSSAVRGIHYRSHWNDAGLLTTMEQPDGPSTDGTSPRKSHSRTPEDRNKGKTEEGQTGGSKTEMLGPRNQGTSTTLGRFRLRLARGIGPSAATRSSRQSTDSARFMVRKKGRKLGAKSLQPGIASRSKVDGRPKFRSGLDEAPAEPRLGWLSSRK